MIPEFLNNKLINFNPGTRVIDLIDKKEQTTANIKKD